MFDEMRAEEYVAFHCGFQSVDAAYRAMGLETFARFVDERRRQTAINIPQMPCPGVVIDVTAEQVDETKQLGDGDTE